MASHWANGAGDMQNDRFWSPVPHEHLGYERVVQSLSPCDVPCIHCGHRPRTHGHGCYEREPKPTDEESFKWFIHPRLCPVCERTFSLSPICLTPFQRVFVQVQDGAISLFAGRNTIQEVLELLREIGISVFESTVRRWYARLRGQIEPVLRDVSRRVQVQRPDAVIPPLRIGVRDSEVLYHYERLLAVPAHTGHVNATLGAYLVGSPSVTVNRVSFATSPGNSP